jgi:hypothetical protein
VAIYSLGLNSTVTTIASSAMDILAASTNAPRIVEIGVSLGAATASTYGLGRAGNTPVQTSGVALLAENPNDGAANTKAAVAWGTAPTVPANFFRRISLPATIGAGVIWTFPRGLILAASAAMEFWNIAANSASVNVNWVVDE